MSSMSAYNEHTYWIAIAHLPRWSIERINRLIVQVTHDSKITWTEFFETDRTGWREMFAFTEKELSDLELARKDLPRLAFIAEQLDNEGFQIIPINSSDYPTTLKENLKIKSSPPVLYTKGRKGLLKEDVVPIVGSRNAGKIALDFTDYVAKKCVHDFKVVVSGFAKGVDKQALDSTLEAHGKSIIVLPQGILTFQSGFKKYYEPIVNGEVLVLSTFFPKAGWDAGLAMARNAYIYGLATEIYVAESDSKGGTWEGAMDGLKKHRKIYVRWPETKEDNANSKLVELGAIPVDMKGELLDLKLSKAPDLFGYHSEKNILHDPSSGYQNGERNIEKELLELLKRDSYTTKEILLILKLDWDSRKLTTLLKKNPNVKSIGGKPSKFALNDNITPTLFD